MRIRTESLLMTAGMLLVSVSAACAAEPNATGAAKDHDCNLPANVRSKVDHCDQVGDFDSTEHRKKPGFLIQEKKHVPVSPLHKAPADKLNPSKKLKTDKKSNSPVKKDILEVRSDSEPPANSK